MHLEGHCNKMPKHQVTTDFSDSANLFFYPVPLSLFPALLQNLMPPKVFPLYTGFYPKLPPCLLSFLSFILQHLIWKDKAEALGGATSCYTVIRRPFVFIPPTPALPDIIILDTSSGVT